MPKNPPPPNCLKCGKAMRFVLIKAGGRRFRCIDCDALDPLQLPEIKELLSGALKCPD
jgi:hypothetical protein